jgi:hypothetical protein
MSATDAAGRHDELLVDAPGPWWLPLPRGLDGEARTTWFDDAVTRATAAVAHWPEGAAELVPAILAHAIDSRGDDGVVLLFLSPTAPACATLRLSVVSSPGVGVMADELRGATSSLVTRIDGAGLGHGAEWVHGAPLPGGTGEQLAGLQWCFADDEVLALATLDPVPPPMLAHVADAARELVLGLRRVRDDGDWLAPALPDDVGARAAETWPDPQAGPSGRDGAAA